MSALALRGNFLPAFVEMLLPPKEASFCLEMILNTGIIELYCKLNIIEGPGGKRA